VQKLFQFYNPHTYIYQSWNVGKNRFSSCWDIQWDKPLFAISFQKYKFFSLWRYWTKVHHIYTWCRGIIGTIKLLIHIAIFQSLLKCQGAEWRSFAKIGCHGNVRRGIGKTGPDWPHSRKYLSFGEKIVKIGPVDPEIASLNLKKKKETEGKIYSPVGNLAERAKLFVVSVGMMWVTLKFFYHCLIHSDSFILQ